MSVFFSRMVGLEAGSLGGGRLLGVGRVVERWRCGGRVVVSERPSMVVSWVLGVVVMCIGVGGWGLVRPVERVVEAAEVVGVESVAEAWEVVDWVGEAAALGGAEAAVEDVEEAMVDDEVLVEPAAVLTVDDVFRIPAAAMVEPLRRVEPVARDDSPPRPRARSTTSVKNEARAAGSAAGAAAGRSGGVEGGAGEGGGGAGAAGGGRGAGYFPTPPYPAQARSRGQQGTVQLTIVFGSEGRVTSAAVSRSSGYSELDRTAAQWVRRHWRAAAGQVGTFRLPVHFKLR